MYLPIFVGSVVRQQKWQLMMMQELLWRKPNQ
jgi:hypothetical protein